MFTEHRDVFRYCPYLYTLINLCSKNKKGINVHRLNSIGSEELQYLQILFSPMSDWKPAEEHVFISLQLFIYDPFSLAVSLSKCSFDCTSCSPGCSASCERVSVMVMLSCLKCGLFFSSRWAVKTLY